jgi:hypothetical protein
MRSLLAVMMLIMLLAPAATGWGADIVGTWKTEDNQALKLSYRDDNHIRMDTAPDSYILVCGSKAYLLNRVQGKWQASDLDQMVAMMKQMFGKGDLDPQALAEVKPRFEPTGRTETIAGFKGEVYEVTYTGADGKEEQTEVALCKDPDVKRLNQGWSSLASRLAQMLGRDTAEALKQATKASMEQGLGGMLRTGNEMVLQSLEKPSLSASHYELPPGVEMVNMGETGAEAVGPAGGAAGRKKAYGEDLATDAADEVRDTAEEGAREIKDEAKEEAKDSMKEGMRKAIEGLW